MKTDILEAYFNHIKRTYCCKVCDERFGKKYIIKEQLGSGSLLRVCIEDGLELTTLESDDIMALDFDNRGFDHNFLEIGYCYRGEVEIIMLPSQKKYTIKAGDVFIYKMLNDVEHFQFKYIGCKTISISMDYHVIKKATNPKWKDTTLEEWQKYMNQLFKGGILIIEEASYEIEKITKQIDEISIGEILGYVSLKSKTLEFLFKLINEKRNSCTKCCCSMSDLDKVALAQDLIQENLEVGPSVKALSNQLDMSIYKLQKGFKEVTGDTVYLYIKKKRIEKARALLKDTDLSVLQIANEVGYENPSKFAQLFKHYNSMTPLEYRKS